MAEYSRWQRFIAAILNRHPRAVYESPEWPPRPLYVEVPIMTLGRICRVSIPYFEGETMEQVVEAFRVEWHGRLDCPCCAGRGMS